ncbi:hypothetical protein K438DRAFT_1781451 [Mycena galopus ATCC 62051]|nr:hypothetical protein K438DRAFT_1781451 [Mycena galopus ATCC 62051]
MYFSIVSRGKIEELDTTATRYQVADSLDASLCGQPGCFLAVRELLNHGKQSQMRSQEWIEQPRSTFQGYRDARRILPGFPVRQNFAWFGALAVENEGDLSDKSNLWDLTIRNVDILDLQPRKPHLGTWVTLHHMEISIRECCEPNTHKSMMLKDLNYVGSTGNLEPILLVQLDFIKCRLIS